MEPINPISVNLSARKTAKQIKCKRSERISRFWPDVEASSCFAFGSRGTVDIDGRNWISPGVLVIACTLYRRFEQVLELFHEVVNSSATVISYLGVFDFRQIPLDLYA